MTELTPKSSQAILTLIGDLYAQVGDLQRSLASTLKERDDLVSENETLDIEVTTRRMEAEAMIGAQNLVNEACRTLTAERNDLRAQRDEMRRERDSIKAERDALEDKRDALALQVTDLQTRSALAPN